MRSMVRICAAVAGACALALSGAASAAYPDGPVRLIVPLSAGGAIDSAARIIAQPLSEALGQSVVVENRPGALGSIGALAVINAKPDGQTLFFTSNTAICAVPTLLKNPPYDPMTAFAPVSLVGMLDMVLFANPEVPGKTLDDVIAYAKAHPGKINFATPNSSSLLASAQVQQIAGLKAVNVPYKGDAPALTDLLSGRVQLMFGSPGAPQQYLEQGKLHAIAALSQHRIPTLPDVPTMAEAGMGGVSVVAWIGVFGPAKTPADVTQRLSDEIGRIVARPDIRDQLLRYGVNPRALAPAELGRFAGEQIAAWRKTIREAGIEQQ